MPIINKQNLGEAAAAPGLETCLLVSAGQGSQSLYIEEVTIAPNARIPRTVNPHTEVAVIVQAGRLDALAARTGKPIVVAEVGLRSARGAAAKPWESAEERDAAPDAPLQAEVLADWLAVLDRPTIQGVLVWRWFTDPDAGGPADTDFTVQGKPAEGVLSCAWLLVCSTR